MATDTSPIRTARERAGLTQEEAAHRAGISWPTWQRAESGATVPIRLTRRAIAAVLGVDEADLWPETVPVVDVEAAS